MWRIHLAVAYTLGHVALRKFNLFLISVANHRWVGVTIDSQCLRVQGEADNQAAGRTTARCHPFPCPTMPPCQVWQCDNSHFGLAWNLNRIWIMPYKARPIFREMLRRRSIPSFPSHWKALFHSQSRGNEVWIRLERRSKDRNKFHKYDFLIKWHFGDTVDYLAEVQGEGLPI